MSGDERNANVVLSADVSTYNQNISAAEQNTNKLLTAVTGVTVAMNRLAQSSGKSIQLVGAGTLAGLTAATAAAARFDTQMQQLQASSMMTGRSHEAMTRQVQRMRSEVNMTTSDITSLFTQLNKLGQGNRSIGGLALEFTKLGAVTGESIPALTQSMIMLQRQMGTEGVANTRKYSSVLAHLSENAGVSATAVTDFANAIAPVGKLANMNQQQIMAFSATFAKAGADGFAGANAFNKVLTQITRSTQFGGPELKAYANLLGVTTDEFKKMDSAEQVTQVFEEITKQGPQAIKTLERFGLDGMRTYKSLVAVMGQEGGFRKALGLAEEGGSQQGIDKTAKAAQEAMAGLEDQIGKLGNTMSKIGQSLGVGLLTPLEKVTTGLNTVLTPLSRFMDLLGAIPGLTAAAGAGALIMGGTLVRSIGGMLGIAGVAQLARSAPVAGWNAARRGRTPQGFASMPAYQQIIARDVASQSQQRIAGVPRGEIRGQAGLAQRLGFATAYGLGRTIPGGGYDPEGRGLVSRTGSMLNRAGGAGIRFVGGAIRMGLDPLRPSSLVDITNRDQLTQNLRGTAPAWARRSYTEMQAGQQGMRTSAASIARMFVPPRLADTSTDRRAASAEMAARQRHTGIIGSATREMIKLTAASARASAGLAGVGLAVGGNLAARGVGAIGRGLGAATALVGGGAGVALLGGMYVGGKILDSRAKDKEALGVTEDTSTASAYRTALGQASVATQSFADAVSDARNQIVSDGDYRKSTSEDLSLARRSEFTDPRWEKMSADEARAFASTALPGLDDKGKKLLQGDILKRFGDLQFADELLNQSTPDVRTLFESIGKQKWYNIGSTDDTRAGGQDAGSTVNALIGVTSPENQEAVREAALLEAAVGSVRGAQSRTEKSSIFWDGGAFEHEKSAAQGLARILGTQDEESKKDIEDAIRHANQGTTDAEIQELFINYLKEQDSTAAEYTRQSFGGADAIGPSPNIENGRIRYTEMVGGSSVVKYRDATPDELAGVRTGDTLQQVHRDAYMDPFRDWNVNRDEVMRTSLGGMIMGQPTLAGSPYQSTQTDANEAFLRGGGIQFPNSVMAPSMLSTIGDQGAAVQSSITQALTTDLPGLDNRAIHQIQKFALEQAGGDYAAADIEMQAFADSIGDTDDELYGLIQAARQLGDTFHGISLGAASSAEIAQMSVDRRNRAADYYEQNPESPEAFPALMAAEEEMARQQSAMRQRNIGIIVGKRELDIGQQHQTEDFERSMGFREDDFYLQRERAQEDRDIQLERMEENRTIQLGRTYRDYNLSRNRQEYEFNLSRTRQDQSYGRQLKRTYRDYNLTRERQEYDFTLSRERQDESYGRQLTRSWRDFNLSRERGEYEFNLQRERGQEQFELTLFRSNREFNKQRKRQQFDYDLSRRRAEEDFNHQVEIMAKQTAQSVYNIYERVAVARTLSGQNLVSNLGDQQRRIQEQTENLDTVRGMGLSDAVIQMLGLGDAANSQQLARLIQDMMKDPALVEALNQMVQERTDATTQLITDSSSLQWEEMQRQYNLSMERGAEDFTRSIDRAAQDFAQGLADMREDYNRSLEYSSEDFARSRRNQREDFLTGLNDQRVEYTIQMEQSLTDYNRMRDQQQRDFITSIRDQKTEYNIQMEQSLEDYNRMRAQQQTDFNTGIADQHADYLRQLAQGQEDWERARGHQITDFETQNTRMYAEMARMQARATAAFNRNAEEITGSNEELATQAIDALTGLAKDQYVALNKILFDVGDDVRSNVDKLAQDVIDVADSLGLTGVYVKSGGGGSGAVQYKAEGGTIDGYSPHEKADNIPIMATAGEYMQPVKSVQHYGVNVMEAIRERKIPKEALQGFADGGLIGGGSKEQSLINFGRWLQGQGYHVGEHPLFGGVHPGAHLPTSQGGLHYVGKAIDVNYDGYGQARENRALDAIIAAAERVNLGYIWRSSGHYDHAHFDVSNRRRLNGQMVQGFGAEQLMNITTDEHGNIYDKTFFDLLRKKSSFGKFEKAMDWKFMADRYPDDNMARAVSMKIAEAYGGMYEGEDFMNVTPGQGVERWRPLVLQALQRVGQPSSLAAITLQRMMQESSGNPNAINNWDSNARAGTPSKGLMQVIDPTFRAYRDTGLKNDIWDPMANVVASMRYAMDRYGGLYKAYSRQGGYAEGGEVKETDWYGGGGLFKSPTKIGIGEAGPEMVLPLNNQGAEFLSEVMRKNNPVAFQDAYTARNSVPEVSKRIVYNYRYDHSTNFSGPVNVTASDPNEMARKLELKKREAALIGRH